MNRYLGFFFVVALAQMPLVALADPLTLEQYLARVEQDAPALVAAQRRVEAAGAMRPVARRTPRASLELGLAAVDISGEGAPTSTLLGVALPLELGGDRRARLASADAEVAAMEADSALVARELRLRAGLAFVDALEAQAVAEVARDRLARAERGLEAERRRISISEGTRVALHAAELEVMRARALVARNETLSRARRVVLSEYLVSSSILEVEPQGSLELESIPTVPSDEAMLVALALESRPEASSIRASFARDAARIEEGRAVRVGDALLRVGWTHNTRTNEPQFAQRANDLLSATIGIPLPAGLLRGSRERIATSAAQSAADASLVALEAKIRTEVRSALVLFEAERLNAEAMATGVQTAADSLLEAATLTYERSESSLASFLAARTEWNRVSLERVSAAAEAMRAHLRLEASIGAALRR